MRRPAREAGLQGDAHPRMASVGCQKLSQRWCWPCGPAREVGLEDESRGAATAASRTRSSLVTVSVKDNGKVEVAGATLLARRRKHIPTPNPRVSVPGGNINET